MFHENNLPNSPGKRLFQEAYESIMVVESLYSREVEPGKEGEECRRELNTDTEWKEFRDRLERLNCVVDKLLKTLPVNYAHED